MNNVRQEIREFIVSSFLFGDDKGLADNTSLLEQGIIDSTGLLELATHLEEKIGIKIKPNEFECLDSIDSIMDLLARKRYDPSRV